MYYIWDNYNEQWVPIGFWSFEEAEKYMYTLINARKEQGLSYDYDIYEKIT